ncbi:unnamed protein product [Mytilus coruscus]|uniref:TRIM2_3 n=1 Tax=Mytilus coruscus TaxID=42192 RepID=A0A6J8AUV9_MYTCO|nr:unnamed protein product [Mytilus coruscus]
MYVGLTEIEKTASQAAKYTEGLKRGGQFDENNLEVTISSELQSILKDVKSFGDIYINTSPFTLQVKAGRKDQAQYLVHTIPRLEQIKPSMLRQLTIPKDMQPIDILACRILPDGKYLILDSHISQSHLLLFSNEGMFMREVVTFTRYSPDTCFVRNNTVAVTLGLEKQTALVDVEKNKIIKTIDLSHVCDGVASDNQMLVISSMKKSTIVNLNDDSNTILKGILANCVAFFKGNIYGSICKENKVCCYKSTGETLWTFMHHDIEKPGQLTLDKNGFVYIASRGNYKIVVISPDGKTCKTILSEADGIKNNFAIDTNRATGMMIVSSEISIDSEDKSYETAFVYEI